MGSKGGWEGSSCFLQAVDILPARLTPRVAVGIDVTFTARRGIDRPCVNCFARSRFQKACARTRASQSRLL